MGHVEYVIKDSNGKPYRAVFKFNTAEELANMIDLDTLLSVTEIADCVMGELSDEDIRDIAALPFKELINFHSTLGQDIRNTFGLWIENNPNVEFHPDDTSMDVLTLLWKACQAKVQLTSQVMKFN